MRRLLWRFWHRRGAKRLWRHVSLVGHVLPGLVNGGRPDVGLRGARGVVRVQAGWTMNDQRSGGVLFGREREVALTPQLHADARGGTRGGRGMPRAAGRVIDARRVNDSAHLRVRVVGVDDERRTQQLAKPANSVERQELPSRHPLAGEVTTHTRKTRSDHRDLDALS